MNKFKNIHLREAEAYIKENYPDSYSYENTQEYSTKSNKVIIGQNNLIIALLASLHSKIETSLTGKSTEDIEGLDLIVRQLKDLKIGEAPKIRRKPNYLVWKPRSQK